ncbi:tw-component sensor kinase [Taylorella asinigenitalis MCE3]|uniref:histidine kinase n=2 Tax=Taylorella asinigenitalis TaxID=84590 RepID=G4Q9Q7_TAYAM|nr:PAS domain S-box protein [Taylorella asinigenitalis]AEP36673.1 tw-component sensor kinase [Taylorella asinigenitalis MCE3]
MYDNTQFLSQNFTPKKRSRMLPWVVLFAIVVLLILIFLSVLGYQDLRNYINSYSHENGLKNHQDLLFFIILLLAVFILFIFTLMWKDARERYRTELKLENEILFRRAMENSMSTGMRVIDLKGQILYVNPAFCRLIGWDESSLVGTSPPYAYWIPGNHKEHIRSMDIVLSGRTPTSGIEIDVQRRDGSQFTTCLYVSPLRSPNGEQMGWMTSMTDITESKRSRLALSAAHERFMTVLESMDDAISVCFKGNKGLELLFANQKYRAFFGNSPQGHQELSDTQNINFEQTNLYKSPSLNSWFEVNSRSLTWTDGRKVTLQVARDVTEKLKNEEAYRMQQEKIELTSRLTTMGEMASMLAHELNQPLTAIVNYNSAILTILREDEHTHPKVIEALEKSAKQAERAGRIISHIRAFVKRHEARHQTSDIANIIDSVCDLAEIEAKKNGATLDIVMDKDIPKILADPILIQQVILNLIKNGIEAMQNSKEKLIRVIVRKLEKDLQIQVVDHGSGLKNPNRVFEPFFSTKEKGLGMGLNICRTIVEAHHSKLIAIPNPKGGTIFQFSLPYANSFLQSEE